MNSDADHHLMCAVDYEDDVTYGDDYKDDDVDLNQDVEGYLNDDDARNPFKDFQVLSEEEIRYLQEDDINKVCTLLSVSRVSATTLLCYYNWNVEKVQDEWFSDEAKVREKVGLMAGRTVLKYSKTKKVNCPICFDSHRRSKMESAACGHLYCYDCWKGYVRTAINDGAGCLGLRCPDPSCSAAVDWDMIDHLVSKEYKRKYSKFVLRSYVENNKKIKWCPAPDCNFAVHSDAGCSSGNNLEVMCSCLFHFCWNCKEEAHSPIDCDTTSKWIVKNNADGENVTWLLTYTKPCPRCKRNIEKNSGCMHMTCSAPCRHEFCWLCLGDWKRHDGSHYVCNRYNREQKEGIRNDDEKRMEMAKNSIERYTHYYERWAANHSSMQKARKDLQKLGTQHMKILSDKLGKPETELSFLNVAWMQIVECRRVLKWSYAYGYYLPENEKANKDLFEYSQGLAELNLEKLHRDAEENLQIFLNAEEAPDNFWELKRKLTGITVVTKNFFENLVRYLENGLPEVISDEASPRKKARTEVKQQEDRTKNRGKKAKKSSQSRRSSTSHISD